MQITVGRVRWKFKKLFCQSGKLLLTFTCLEQLSRPTNSSSPPTYFIVANDASSQTTCNNKKQQTSPTGCATIIALSYWTELLLCPVLQRTQILHKKTHFKTYKKKTNKKTKAIPYSSLFTAIIYFLYLSHLQSTKNYTYPKPPGLDLLRKRLC